MTTLLAQAWYGMRMTLLSFDVLRKHLKLIAYSAVTPVLTLAVLPILFDMILHERYLPLPDWADVMLMSFINRIVFNFIYIGLVFYHLRLFQEQQPSLRESITLSAHKLPIVIGWALVSAIVGTSLGTLGTMYHDHTRLHTMLMGLDIAWWLIDFMIIPVFAHNQFSVAQGLVWTVRSLVANAFLVLPAGGLLLLMKGYTGEVIGYSILNTLRFLQHYPTLISITLADVEYIRRFIQVTGLIIAAFISSISSAAEATLATGLYVKIIGQPAHELEEPYTGRLIVIGVLLLIIVLTIAVSVATGLSLIAFNPLYKETLKELVIKALS